MAFFLPLLNKFINSFLPPRCLVCHDVLESAAGLCGSCWSTLQFISDPCCYVCGVPFEFHVSVDLTCMACLVSPPLFEKARAPMVYEGIQKELILRFKHADATHMAPLFGRFMTRVGMDFLKECHALVPVPLHWTRLLRRRYNQASLLAQVISKNSHCPHWPTLLKRKRRTSYQGQKNRKERMDNVKNVFCINKSLKHKVKGLTLCLVDDVLTSGATVTECIKILKKAGVHKVYVLTLVRVTLN